MPIQKMKFLDVFKEDTSENLTLQVKLRVESQDFNVDDSFGKGEKIGGVDFHIMRYFDIAVEPDGDVYVVKGFLPEK